MSLWSGYIRRIGLILLIGIIFSAGGCGSMQNRHTPRTLTGVLKTLWQIEPGGAGAPPRYLLKLSFPYKIPWEIGTGDTVTIHIRFEEGLAEGGKAGIPVTGRVICIDYRIIFFLPLDAGWQKRLPPVQVRPLLPPIACIFHRIGITCG